MAQLVDLEKFSKMNLVEKNKFLLPKQQAARNKRICDVWRLIQDLIGEVASSSQTYFLEKEYISLGQDSTLFIRIC